MGWFYREVVLSHLPKFITNLQFITIYSIGADFKRNNLTLYHVYNSTLVFNN